MSFLLESSGPYKPVNYGLMYYFKSANCHFLVIMKPLIRVTKYSSSTSTGEGKLLKELYFTRVL